MNMPLVLLPGMMCDARLFTPQIDYFSAERAVQVACLTRHNRVEDMARAVLATAPERFALAGLSMGGIVAMEVVRQAPDRVVGLALLDTNPLAEDDRVKAGRGPQMQTAREGGLLDMLVDKAFPNYLAAETTQAPILATCFAMAESLGADVFIRQSEALMHRPDQTETLRQYRSPAMILCGEQDRLCPVSRHTLMSELMPHASLDVIPAAGHLVTLEKPIETNKAMAQWLEAL
ncbi:alpha/beta fold hydrolase [Saccharospirillum alexandrii]|uniref:alpha/beta fold hydrolase n=1 Tax=Saccharospirillum alexandrii TaxID=2448477 RepID=UPI000FDA9AE1|nr:alpha/beta hydrolase [Saccharospirillum alexandrii]